MKNMTHFKVPYLRKEDLWLRADELRAKVWTDGSIPVDVMEIVEFELDMEVRPISRLQEDADVDALLLSDWKTIIVDHEHFMNERYTNRLRFSIAHEMGHYVLHKHLFSQFQYDTAEEWAELMLAIPETEYSYLEYHANEFAGRFLVPLEALKRELEEKLVIIEKAGISRATLDDGALSYIANGIAKAFALSSDVIERRLQKENLWPLT